MGDVGELHIARRLLLTLNCLDAASHHAGLQICLRRLARGGGIVQISVLCKELLAVWNESSMRTGKQKLMKCRSLVYCRQKLFFRINSVYSTVWPDTHSNYGPRNHVCLGESLFYSTVIEDNVARPPWLMISVRVILGCSVCSPYSEFHYILLFLFFSDYFTY